MHIELGPSLLKEMGAKGLSIEIDDDTIRIGGAVDLDEQVEAPEPGDQLPEEEEEEPGTTHHLEIRLGKGFEFPICDEEDLLALRKEFDETSGHGYYRAVVVGDICGEVCFALAENNPGSTVYSVGLHDLEDMPDNVKTILQEPKQAAKELDYQAINALYILSDALDFERSLTAWMKHLTNGGKLFIIDPETSPQTAGFKRDNFACISPNVYMRKFIKEEDVKSSV